MNVDIKISTCAKEDEDEHAKYGSTKDVVARQSPIVPDARSDLSMDGHVAEY
jgi:hypothetical protein